MTEEQIKKFYRNIVTKLCPDIPEKDKKMVYEAISERHISGVDEIYNPKLLKLKKTAIAELITLNYGMNTIGFWILRRDSIVVESN